jgi:FAD/FMN-containing dehydrogenase
MIRESMRALDASAVARLQQRLQGEVIQPGDDGYEDARRVWNQMIDRRPRLIARCHAVDDVVAALEFARTHKLAVAVRGGGHNVAGSGSVDGGIVIDLSPMQQVQVDPELRVAKVQAGATLGHVDRVTQLYGLATPTGNVSRTGIAGLTLSGGISWLRRKHGLSVDNLLGVEMVLADGSVVRANAGEHPDLYWGVLGGGGNFGIVTSFEFRLHEVGPQLYYAGAFYPEESAVAVLQAWRNWTLTAPDAASSDFVFWSVPAAPNFPATLHNRRVVIVGGLYAGPAAEGERTMQPLRQIGTPLLDMSGVMPYLAVQSMFDPLFPDGLYHYWKSLYLDELTDEAIVALVKQAAMRPSLQTLVPIRHMGGAIARVAGDATPLANRQAQYLLSIDSTWADPANTEANLAWSRSAWQQMRHFARNGVYLNFADLGADAAMLVQGAYGDNYSRLVALKERYDPENCFRVNHNIPPSRPRVAVDAPL